MPSARTARLMLPVSKSNESRSLRERRKRADSVGAWTRSYSGHGNSLTHKTPILQALQEMQK